MEKRRDHALANYRDEFILATGGKKSGFFKTKTATAEVYSVAGNRWSPVPDMNVSRNRHGSCAVANYVYVACGYRDDYSSQPIKYLQSIERINMDAIDDGWEKLLVSSSENLSPRDEIFMAALSCDELVIIGGYDRDQGYMGDGYILEIPKMRLKTVIKNTKESIKFVVVAN